MARLSRYFELVRNDVGEEHMRVDLDGVALLRLALTNKGTAFPLEERVALRLDGLLPPHVSTVDEQLARVYAAFSSEPTSLAKYSYLRSLQERNEILFYALLERHLEEMLPIVYTPTVGEAVQKFNALYQSARGLSLSIENIARAPEAAKNCLLDDVRMVVATDSSAILGIGDQGYGGVAIAIGKLALYTVAGGVSPYRSLPLGLDVGTDQKGLADRPEYLGVRMARLKGEAYLAFMDRVVEAVGARWPRAILQWEDLSKDAAFAVLERYRRKIPSFNDDIQGTGAVALAGMLAACASQGRKLSDERVLVYGAGAGGAGVALAIREGMKREGLTEAEARSRVFVLDSKGLLVEGRPMEDYKKTLAQEGARVAGWPEGPSGPFDLLATIKNARVTALLGLSGQGGAFTEPVVRALAPNAERPIVFALSNPTSACEAAPADMLSWTDGRALVATGSPFAPVRVGGRDVPVGQGNNAFVFPGIGFGSILADASEITDNMVLAAAYALADYTRSRHAAEGLLYPPVGELRAVSLEVATRVLEQAFADGVARTVKVKPEGAAAYVRSKAWNARYVPFRRALAPPRPPGGQCVPVAISLSPRAAPGRVLRPPAGRNPSHGTSVAYPIGMLNLRTTTLLCFLTTLVALSAAGCDGNNEGDGAEGGGQKLVPPSDPGDPSDFETLEACRLAEPCPESTTQLIENISRNLDPSRSRCLLQGLRDRTPGRYFYTTDHAFSNGGVGARHLLVVSADGSVAYAHNDYGPGTTSGQPAERCELADANYFASCLTALEGVSKDDSLSDDVNDAAWACLFGTGPTTEPSRLAWLASCAPEAPRCE